MVGQDGIRTNESRARSPGNARLYSHQHTEEKQHTRPRVSSDLHMSLML